jgi:hypothetical protein
MEFFANYLIILGWAIVVSIVMAVSYGISIWILEKMIGEIKGLRHMMKKPIASSIVIGAFILAVAIIVSALC